MQESSFVNVQQHNSKSKNIHTNEPSYCFLHFIIWRGIKLQISPFCKHLKLPIYRKKDCSFESVLTFPRERVLQIAIFLPHDNVEALTLANGHKNGLVFLRVRKYYLPDIQEVQAGQ